MAWHGFALPTAVPPYTLRSRSYFALHTPNGGRRISIAVIIVTPSPQDLRDKMESLQHAAESIEEERQSFKAKETAFTIQINDQKAELRDARRKSKAVQVSTTWEIQKLVEKQMMAQKKKYKDTIRFCPGQRGVEGVMFFGEIWDVGWL